MRRNWHKIRLATIILALGVAVFLNTPTRDAAIGLADRAVQFSLNTERAVRLRLGIALRGTPDLERFEQRLKEKRVALGAQIFMRIFKKESELELWLRRGGKFVHFATYPICRWSGHLGPKLKEGDRQSPEGFYTVSRRQLNPNSRWHRSFNLGFPNTFDRAHGRTGSFLMVHGGCGSIGCYAMTNAVIDEIWRLVTASLDKGQARFHVHVFPFRMTNWNLAVHERGRWQRFWSDLKKGYQLFDASHVPPRVSVCRKRYVVAPAMKGRGGSDPIGARCVATAESKTRPN